MLRGDAVSGYSADLPCDEFIRFRQELLQAGQGILMSDYRTWLNGRGSQSRNPDIHAFVHGISHVALDRITLPELRAAVSWGRMDREERHALGDSRGTAPHRWVDDFDTPWTFNYMLHDQMESIGRIPYWQEFKENFSGNGRARYYDPICREYRRRFPERADGQHAEFSSAMRWRVGCGYYSFLRELHLYTQLRLTHGLPMRYHVLADAQMKVDMWCGRSLLAVYVENDRFRAGEEGRKRFLSRVAQGSGFSTIEVRLGKPTTFGLPHLVTDAEIARVAAKIRAQNAGSDQPAVAEA